MDEIEEALDKLSIVLDELIETIENINKELREKKEHDNNKED